ncbi:mitochondrial import receptor subunit Tom22 [Microbotryomycetes sp. JL201]|nr:mitochondrial import receptor subunit Tom22 [Microbotryomycetes sp. JL201]
MRPVASFFIYEPSPDKRKSQGGDSTKLLLLAHPLVKITDVKDEDEWSDSSSVVDSVDAEEDGMSDSEFALYDPSQETVRDRLYALKDIVPPETRKSITDSVSTLAGWSKWTVSKIGSAAWITTTSALVVGLPLMLSIEGEAAIVQQEKDYLGQAAATQQQNAASGVSATTTAAAGVVPAGF